MTITTVTDMLPNTTVERGLTEMITYGWTCQVCGALNEASSSSCAACQFPAVAAAYEIERAKEAGISSSNPHAPEQMGAAPPTWKLVLLLFALIAMLAGAFFIVVGGVRVMLLGASLAAAGALVFWLMGGFTNGKPHG